MLNAHEKKQNKKHLKSVDVIQLYDNLIDMQDRCIQQSILDMPYKTLGYLAEEFFFDEITERQRRGETQQDVFFFSETGGCNDTA